ncbi:MAG TPA: choice-of-anchor V domain-containing protein [Gemmatimonadota bacterium]|nr:choice-of-anchor V domain-containing protein [Gemmatimonadota bacterium]
MRSPWAAAALGALPAALAAPIALTLYVDKPPPGTTGGFGEPTCHACHFDQPLDAPGGSLEIRGVPERYAPGRVYAITVELQREGAPQGGFQLAARFADGAQAGALVPVDDRVAVTDSLGIRYAHHTAEGVEPTPIRWTVTWRAPAAAGEAGDGPARDGDVLFHAAGNAANGDFSPLGDFVYTASARTVPCAPADR